MSESERNGERNCSKLDGNILKPIGTSTPKKRCLDLCDSDTSSVDLGTPSKRWVDLNDSNSSEQWNDITPIKEAVTETSPKNINQSVWINMLDSDDDIEETIQPFDGKENDIVSLEDDSWMVEDATSEVKVDKPQEIVSLDDEDDSWMVEDASSETDKPQEIISLEDEDDSWMVEDATSEVKVDKPQDQQWLISCLQKKRIFLDLISKSEEDISSLVKWLDCVAKASVSSFLHKRVDVVISDRDDTCRKRKTLNNLHTTCGADQKRSMIMLGMAAASAECSGSSSVFSIATKWNMTVLKYVDVLACMKRFNLASPHDHSQTLRKSKSSHKVRSLRSPFIKVEDQSRKFRPEFAEMRSFPYIDFNTEGTGSPFDTWFRENTS